VSFEAPIAEDEIDDLPEECCYFTTLDLAKGYLQCKLSEESSELVVISTASGSYRYKVMALGLKPAVAEFQTRIERLLGDNLRPYVKVYIDDIIIATPDIKTHCWILRQVLSKFKAVNLKLRRGKCSFAQPEAEFLGYKINRTGIWLDRARIDAILKMKKPTNASEVRMWLGTLQMLRRFSPKFAEVSAPLNKVSHNFEWKSEQEEAFENLKRLLASCEFKVSRFNTAKGKQIVVETDASKIAVAGVLFLEHPDMSIQDLVYCFSRTLKKAETRYSTIRREALGVLWSLRKFEKFLRGRSFVIRTDHKPLVGLLQKDLHLIQNEHLRDYVEEIRGFSFKVEYVPGEDNIADGLSRLALDQLYEYLEHKRDGEDYLVFTYKGEWKRFIDPGKRTALLVNAHGRIHAGYTEMCKALGECTWPEMHEDVKDFLASCRCSLMKANKRKVLDFGKPKEIPEIKSADAAFALDLFAWKDKKYLSILDLKNDIYYCLEVAGAAPQDIENVLGPWSDSLGVDLAETVFMTDRGGEFASLTGSVKGLVRTAAYSPQRTALLSEDIRILECCAGCMRTPRIKLLRC
jgi:hypothetical protein